MPQLIIEQPGIPPMTVELNEEVTGFGRAEDNQIVLIAEEVSRYHAKIRIQSENTILEDLKSLNGTYVNRQRIVERVLSDNDEVWFGGKCRAIFKDDPDEVKEKRRQESTDKGSELSHDLEEIREEMDRVSASMTMMATQAGPQIAQTIGATQMHGEAEVAMMGRAFRRLDALYKASNLIASDFDLENRMQRLLDLAIEVMGAERGFLMLKEEGSEELGAKVAREMGQELESSGPSMGIARRAAVDGEPVLMADSGADAQFGMRESIIRQRILSAMCVPLRIEDRILGALYVDSRKQGVEFSQEDLELFQALANQSAMAIENTRLYERMVEAEKKKASLGRFLSPAVVDVIMNHDTDLELGGKMRMVTTLFCDIRGFTTLAEKMSPEGLVDLLNQHFTAMTEIVFRHEGTLDKYNGDEVMALFGAPFSSGSDVKQAVDAAIYMQLKNTELNEKRRKAGKPEFEMGIGINTGDVIAGYIGSPDRMDFTVLGDHVNIASRFCSVAKGGQIVVGQSTYEIVKDMVEIQSIGTPILKGKEDPVPAYEVLGFKTS